MKKILFLLTFLLFIQGCTFQKFNISQSGNTIPSYEGMNHYIFWGLGQTRTVDPNDVCGVRGVSGIETGYSVWNMIIDWFTLGIYSTRSYKIYCNQERNNSQRYIRQPVYQNQGYGYQQQYNQQRGYNY